MLERKSQSSTSRDKRTTPRHSSLTREQRWYSIWSLNWDVWLERALHSVGIESHQSKKTSSPTLPTGWVRWYESWVPSKVVQRANQQTVVVYKPHGCVESLLAGDGTFILTRDELGRCLSQQPDLVQAEMEQCFTHHSLITAGWSASEPYLQEFFTRLKPLRSADTTLTVIDPAPNPNGHSTLMGAYDSCTAQTMCQPEFNSFPNTDDVFLWLQTRHGLGCLEAISTGDQRQQVASWLIAFNEPQRRDSALGFMVDWFDNFLPVWLRLCFNNGHQKFFAGLPVLKEAIPTHRRDEHIPWDEQNVERKDLLAAFTLLVELCDNPTQIPKFNYEFFPGALWDEAKHHLIVAVPAWIEGTTQSLAALKPLVESRHWANQGQIRKVSVLGLAPIGSPAMHRDAQLNWTYELS
ncbi:SIR2 family protein [Polaromonas sp. P1(28)-13]|nr:SIR2 family protein [Polaromonas sp. P1(28)-13]